MTDLPPPEPAVTFTLNGETQTTQADPFQPLSATLRDALGFKGTKVGCEAGDCGACTILMNGGQSCSCLIPTIQADGANIETIESKRPRIKCLQDAFHANGAAQCGICTPGMIMAAADLLDRQAVPNRKAIEDAIGGVLCRCTGYLKIIEAIEDAARSKKPAAIAPPSGGAVGASLARVDGMPKAKGEDVFGADFAPPDALWVRVIRSPHARATFHLGDLDAFTHAHAGIERILTSQDIPGRNTFGILPHLKDQPVLAENQVRYRGEAVIALVGARETVQAIDPDTLPIIWSPETPTIGIGASKSATESVQSAFPDNVLIKGRVKRGDLNGAQASAIATGAYTTSFVEHAYIEPEAGFAVKTTDGRIEVSASTQAPYMDLEEVAAVLGVEHDQVRIRPTACGGGFGGKLDISVQPILAVAAWVTGRPVRTVYDRVESMASSTKRHPAEIKASAGANKDGTLRFYRSDADFDTGAYASWGPTVAGRVPVHAAGPYKVPNVLNRSTAWLTNAPPSGAFRGFGVPQAAIAHEGLMDDLAETLDIDRWEIRRINALAAGDLTPTGQVLQHSAGLGQCLDAIKHDWMEFLADAAEFNAGSNRIKRGAGIGCMWYGCGNTSMSNPSHMRVVLGRDGTLTFFNGAVDIGQGSTTVLLQICADALGLPTTDFTLVLGDTDLTEDAGKTSASRQTFVSGNAAFLAGQALRAEILRRCNAGPDASLSLSETELTVVDGTEIHRLDLTALETDLEGRGRYDPPTTGLDEDGQGIPYATYGFAAQIALVDVDTKLGTVKVNHIVAAHDVGRAINPMLVEGQIQGGIAQGLGLALMEEYIPGRTENLHDYLIPTAGDMPTIDIKIIEDPEHNGPFGAKGIGEPALVPTAPAILGGIRHATGAVIRHVPALPHRVWEAMQARS